jgi:DivIVA domain-containing protein
MALTPEDVVNKRFQPTKFREGYDQDEVDDFLDEIVIELRRLNQENDELRKKVAELTSKGGVAAPAEKPAPQEAKPAEVVKPEPPQPAPAPVSSPGSVNQTAESAAGLLAMAQQMHDKHVQDGIEQRDKIIAEAQIEASSLVNEAQEKSRKTLGALEQQRSVLERKVEQLRGFERDYRARLKAYIEGQLRDLDARGSVVSSEIPDNAEV